MEIFWKIDSLLLLYDMDEEKLERAFEIMSRIHEILFDIPIRGCKMKDE